MSLSGSSALARIAMNPNCEIQVAMIKYGRSEKQFYAKVVGMPYDREFGERISARRRGAKFEQNLFQSSNNAALLREVTAPIIGIEHDRIFVRNMHDEVPGSNGDARVLRYRRTKLIIQDALRGDAHPHIIVHPQLLITVPETTKHFWIEPDFMIWSGEGRVFIPGDAKSFVVQENDVDPGDLERTRLQVGAQIVGLRSLYEQLGRRNAVENHGIFIFSTPYGLRPHPPKMESLDGAVNLIMNALKTYARHATRIDVLRAPDNADVRDIYPELQPHFQEKCMSSCVLARVCYERHGSQALSLGDEAAHLLGRNTDLSRITALLSGQPAANANEERIVTELSRLGEALGLIRRVA